MMKKISILFLLLLMMLLPLSASALTQEEWNHWSYSKLSRGVTLYRIDNADTATSTDLTVMQAIGSLPAGTYVRTGASNSALGMRQISYYSGGGSQSAWVESSSITGASVTLTFSDGTTITVSEALAGNRTALQAFLKDVWSDKTLPGYEEEEQTPSDSTSSGTSSGSSGQKSYSAPQAVRRDYTGPHIEQLGLLTTIVRENGENSEVATSSLVLESVDPEYQLAVIHVPKTGKCTMREKPSKKSDMVKNCKAGRVVIVLEWGKEYTRILYNNAEGYVLTSCLKFYPVDTPILGTGTLTWEGKATGRTKINIRTAPDKSAKKVGEWKTGTGVTVFALENGWYEIEHEGEHGYVQEKYLTMAE